MMNKSKLLTIGLLLTFISGCSSALTSIKPTEDPDTYYVTQNFQAPFVVSGSLYKCKASGDKMICIEIDD